MNRRVTESVFLKGDYRIRDQVSSKALILGGDEYGVRIADLLKKGGFESTLLVGFEDKYPTNSALEITQGTITKISGFIGDFQVQIQTSTDLQENRFGFIIAAQPASKQSKTNSFIPNNHEKIYSLSEFKQFLDSGGKLTPKKDGSWTHIAFFFDLKGTSEISQFETLLSILDRLEMLDKVQSYVFTRNVKVASQGLDARYRYQRQHGVVFFKFDKTDPVIVQNEDSLIIQFEEPLLSEAMELTPDTVVIDEILSPADSLEPILKIIPSSPASAPYLQLESTRFHGIETQKAGVYAVGPARGVFDQGSINSDVDAVLVSLLKALPQLSGLLPTQTAFIDLNKCVFCLTCFRLCPHGAIGFDFRPEVDQLSCMACGVCVAECPMGAIDIHWSGAIDSGLEVEKASSIVPGFKQGNRIKLFVCSHSGLQAVAKINSSLLTDVEICELPCAGALNPNSVLRSFKDGAAGIIVAGCFRGNCASVYGSALAEGRLAKITKTLKETGIDQERLKFLYVAGNTPDLIVDAILKIKSRIQQSKII
ncbi:MAG: hydrogenase iron-sulfur subunit [Desulfomonilaceae bacterium]